MEIVVSMGGTEFSWFIILRQDWVGEGEKRVELWYCVLRTGGIVWKGRREGREGGVTMYT